MSAYTTEFYDQHAKGMGQSARAVLPMVFEFMTPAAPTSATPPRSVVDVGCGEGHWLAAARSLGAAEVLGIDGTYVRRDRLAIPADRFLAADLTRPPTLGGTFDLAMCLEVGEHLPDEHAATLVGFVSSLAPIVLFSAAIPKQGGTDHVNEQWPAYWGAKFLERGYLCADVLRRPLWDREDVEWWYAQNALLFLDRMAIERYPKLRGLASESPPMSLVHPTNFLEKASRGRRKTLSRRIKGWMRGRRLE